MPQTERTPFHPRSPYAAAKVYAYWMTVNYREAYGLFAVNGILFNHESPAPRRDLRLAQDHARGRRGSAHGLQERLYLGNLDARRDWGYAKDYVEAMWRMLQQEPSPTTTSSRRARATPCASSASARFARAGWELALAAASGGAEKGVDRRPDACSSRSTRPTCGRPRSTI